ncbi:MAG TPA: hypothetical protein VE988_09200 [Gemmataceae bacterium]|nr:hypothetical protein [Gemmataceae bacterium]
MRRPLFASLFALVCLLAVGASTAKADPPADLSGRWHGTWVSCKDGHSGCLNASFCKKCDNCYQVRFTGTFFAVLPFCFTVDMQVTGQTADGKLILSGSHNLPLFGTYTFNAIAGNCDFTATYTSCDDNGRFTLCR